MKILYLLLIVVWGFLLMPTTSLAWGLKSDKKCCDVEFSANAKNKKYCEKQGSKTDVGCDGKCSDSPCGCAAGTDSFTILYSIYTPPKLIEFKDKSEFFLSETFISSGFTTLWLIPKIV